MSVVLMTNNPRKVAEYRRFLGRHAQSLLVERPTEVPEVLLRWLETARAVLADESNLFDPSGDLVRPGYVGPARNICRLHAWVCEDGQLVRRSYLREVSGHFDASALRPDDPTVFDWDSAFTSASGATLEAMTQVGLKNSAREQCLSAFVKERLRLPQPKAMRWTPHADPADWATDSTLLLAHPLYDGLPSPLSNALRFVVNDGVFFRAANSRREGNYWLPGLNGGVPHVPKSDPLHEATFLFHDVMHQLLPDLVFDGETSEDHRRTYLAWRMMSEAVSLVLADMAYVDSRVGRAEHAGYDFTKRKIHPLFASLPRARRDDWKWLTHAMTRFVLLGEGGELATHGEAWARFSEKYTRFFVADFQWTRMNWGNLVSREPMVRAWLGLVHPETLRAQRVGLVSDVVQRVGRGHSVESLVEALFELAWVERLEPALRFEGARDAELVERSTARGFRRWLLGQVAFFAQYAPLLGVPPLAHELAARVRSAGEHPIGPEERSSLRARFEAHVVELARQGVLSDDDAATFPHCFPLFDPFFLRDYDAAQQEFPTVAEASRKAFA